MIHNPDYTLPDTGGSKPYFGEFKLSEQKNGKDFADYLFNGAKIALQTLQHEYPGKKYFSATLGDPLKDPGYRTFTLSEYEKQIRFTFFISDNSNGENKSSVKVIVYVDKIPGVNQGLIELTIEKNGLEKRYHFSNKTTQHRPIISSDEGVLAQLEKLANRISLNTKSMLSLKNQTRFEIKDAPDTTYGLKGSDKAREKGHLN